MVLHKKQGQSTIEFLLTLVFSIAFLFMFVQLALNSGIGYLNHYATFMASRAYLVFDDNNQVVTSTLENAEDFVRNDVMKKFGLDVMGLKIADIVGNVEINSPLDANKKYEYVGVVHKIKRKFSALSIIGGKFFAELVSESFLGKEPTRGDCLQRLCQHVVVEHLGFECNPQNESNHITLFDDGC
jgi:hypothetical protein